MTKPTNSSQVRTTETQEDIVGKAMKKVLNSHAGENSPEQRNHMSLPLRLERLCREKIQGKGGSRLKKLQLRYAEGITDL